MNPFERLTARLGLALVLGLLVTPLALFVPDSDDETFLLRAATAHLSASMAFALVVSLWAVWPSFRGYQSDTFWFAGLTQPWRLIATAVVHVAAVSGATLLVVMAWGAALRLAPGLQYLQIISALDIVWGLVAIVAVTPVLLEARSRNVAFLVSTALGAGFIAFCQWPLVRYLANVGFESDGGWKVDGAAMWDYILPYDMIAAAFALALVAAAAYVVRQRTRAHDASAAEASLPA